MHSAVSDLGLDCIDPSVPILRVIMVHSHLYLHKADSRRSKYFVHKLLRIWPNPPNVKLPMLHYHLSLHCLFSKHKQLNSVKHNRTKISTLTQYWLIGLKLRNYIMWNNLNLKCSSLYGKNNPPEDYAQATYSWSPYKHSYILYLTVYYTHFFYPESIF